MNKTSSPTSSPKLISMLLLCILVLPFHHANAQTSLMGGAETLRGEITRQAEDILSNMSLREKIGQLMYIRAHGDYYSVDDPNYLELKKMVEEYHVGGIIFFRGDIYNQALLTNRLQQHARVPLWITQDMEFGAAMRINNTTRITPAMGVAATGNPAWAFEKGRITALEAKAVGVHQVFAPVVDVNNNPNNPVINVRSFSEDPEIVSRFASEFIRGVQSQGVVSTAKHFPGHGDTDTDSHFALPTINHSWDRLNSVELVPFRAAIETGVESVMSAHIAFPAINSEPGRPATLDPKVLDSVLRDSLGFKGIIITDALEMQGIAAHYSPGEALILALEAGADMMLLSPDDYTAINEVEAAVYRGQLPEERIDESVLKLLKWKVDYGLMRRRFVEVNRIPMQVNTRRSQMIADEIARESITLLKNSNDIVPISPDRYPKVSVIMVSNHRGGNTGSSFIRAIRNYHPDVNFHNYDSRTSDAELDQMVAAARSSDLIIVGSVISQNSGRTERYSASQRRFLNRLTGTGKPLALVSFSSPYVVSELPGAQVHMLAWSEGGSQPEAAASALFGASPITATLPITIPNLYQRHSGIHTEKTILRRDLPEVAGMSSEALRRVDTIMQEAVRDSVFPGGVVAIARNGIVTYHNSFGYFDYQKKNPVRTNTIYDLASLTKPMATTAAVMMLYDQGKIQLDDPVSKWISEFDSGDRRNVTIKHLLEHTSGLPAFRTYVDQIKDSGRLMQAIKNEPLINPPGEQTVYSDLGFILLGHIVEQISGTGLSQYLNTNLFYPAGMSDTMFNPQRRGRWVVNRIPPSEIDTVYRNREINADVNDERAYYLGGTAGHAGLFGTAFNVAVFGEILLNGGTYRGREFFKPETVELFTGRHSENQKRGLGFDFKSLSGFTTAGQLASDKTYGHLGFTGTSFWIDPENHVSITILTNRTFPYRSNARAINRIRADVADAVINAIND